MRWTLLLLLLTGCLSTQQCGETWGLYLDQDIYDELVAQGAGVDRPAVSLGEAGFPGHEPEASLVEVRWKPLQDSVGGNARPHLALYAADPPEVGLKDGDGMSQEFLVDVATSFMPSRAAAADLIERLRASPVEGNIDFRTTAPEVSLGPSDVDGSKVGGSSSISTWTTTTREEHRHELVWRGPVAKLSSQGLAIQANTRGDVYVLGWPEKPGHEVHPAIRDAFSAAGLPEPDFRKTNPVPSLECTVQRPWR